MSESNILTSKCKICGVPATHLHYDVIACEPCKMFFKRNAKNHNKILKCYFDGQCEVNIYSRHTCSACRLKKCLEVGMCTPMIRCSQTIRKEKKCTSTKLLSMIHQRNQQPQKLLTTLNLLEQDQSSLTTDQWSLLSNLIHAYDENNALAAANGFAKEMNNIHPKLRFKIDANKTIEIITALCQATEPFLKSNHHFASLPVYDRSMVLRGVVDNVSCLGASLVLRQSGLITNAAFRHGMEITYGSTPYYLSVNMILSLDQNIDLVKLSLSIFAFCTSTCTVFNEKFSIMHLVDAQSFFKIQNMYAEAVWRYLLYKYTFEESVLRFSHLVKSIVDTLTIRIHLQNVQDHVDMVQTLIHNIEKEHIDMDEN